MTADELSKLIDDTLTFSEKDESTLNSAQYRRLRDAYLNDVLDVVSAEKSFFILGNYDDDTLERLETVKERLLNEGHAFLLRDTTEAWEYWTTQFKIFADRATHVVGVYEECDGGHEWEAGYLDHVEYRDKTYVLKRRYPKFEPKEEPFDGMMAHYMLHVARRGHLEEWNAPAAAPSTETEEALREAVEQFIEEHVR